MAIKTATLKLIGIEVADFRRSEMHNLADWERRMRRKLQAGQTVMLISRGMDQVIFAYGWQPAGEAANTSGRAPQSVLRSERLRLDHGRWSGVMLGNYAREVGINLVGVKLFQEHFGVRINNEQGVQR
jgi:hypothetical protein